MTGILSNVDAGLGLGFGLVLGLGLVPHHHSAKYPL